MEEYEVEKIIDKRVINGKLEYKIKWVGYPMSQCTWEPIRNLANIKPMIKEYENNEIYDKKQKKISDFYLIGKKRENSNDSSFENYNDYYKKNNLKINNKKNKEKKVIYINDKYKSIYTIKKENSELVAVVVTEENGILNKITIPTQELRRLNPDILIDFYEQRIKFS